jgi:transcriptional regulator with XRE-family HTH domain
MPYLDILSIRREHNITQSELSKLTGYPQSYISRMETGKEPANEDFVNIVKEQLHIENINNYYTDSPIEKQPNISRSFNNRQERNASWQNGVPDAFALRLLDIIDRKDEQIAALQSRLDKIDDNLTHLTEIIKSK